MPILTAFCSTQVKRCAEMSRKLRFLKDQINKAGLMSSHSVLQSDIHLEDLEVLLYFTSAGLAFYLRVWLPAITCWLSAVSKVCMGIFTLESDNIRSLDFS